MKGEGRTIMSIVSISYFLAQLIFILCEKFEKNCEVIQDDEDLTRTDEKCQFPFKYNVNGQLPISAEIILLVIQGKEYDRCICIGDKRCLR